MCKSKESITDNHAIIMCWRGWSATIVIILKFAKWIITYLYNESERWKCNFIWLQRQNGKKTLEILYFGRSCDNVTLLSCGKVINGWNYPPCSSFSSHLKEKVCWIHILVQGFVAFSLNILHIITVNYSTGPLVTTHYHVLFCLHNVLQKIQIKAEFIDFWSWKRSTDMQYYHLLIYNYLW